jgi:hypothetical protein
VVVLNLVSESLCVSPRGTTQLAQILVVVAAIRMEVLFLMETRLTPRTDEEEVSP